MSPFINVLDDIYFNEFDPYAAQWLRNLMAAGLIAPGVVDERSIEDVTPDDLRGYKQCHFFAGIGVWSFALRSAGWRDDQEIWTGSAPCQPFSAAGAGAGFDDERHLWPAFHHLIAERRPAIVLGEQVASKDADPWIDLVHTDMEALGYAFGAIPFPSAGVGAPHIRDRLYWVGKRMADTQGVRRARDWRRTTVEGERRVDECGGIGGLADATIGGRREERADAGGIVIGNIAQGLAPGLVHGGADHRPGPTNGFWRDADWLGCTDGKWRPVEPGTFSLVNGTAGRVGRGGADWRTAAGEEGKGHRAGRLKGYGNAINAEAARIFVQCVMGAV